MRYCIPHLLAAVCLPFLASAQSPAVHAWQDSLQLPTYPENDPDPNPQFGLYGTDNPNYPYPMRSNLTKERPIPQTWRTLNLENEYLLCRVLPDLGGHLYSCRDKRNSRDVFYANPVVKKDFVGLRGAWTAMGIESNFPAAHTRSAASPVDFAVASDPDGSGRAIVQDIDRVTGMEWRVEFVLHPGSAVLEQKVTFYNRASVRRPYDWWANAEVALDDEATRFILPSYLVADHGLQNMRAWPLDSKGVDDSVVAGHKTENSWFAYGSQEPFFAVYKPASRSGLAHFADPRVVTGKKLRIWGSVEDANVRKNLTDNFPSYVEIQAGLFQDQETFHFLEPEEVKSFSESWIPVFDLGGVTRATADAVVNMDRAAGTGALKVEIGATRAIPGAIIRLLRQGVPVFEAHADLSPASIYSHVLENTGDKGAGPVTLQLLDSRGTTLLQHTEGRYDALTAAQVNRNQPPPDPSRSLQTEASLLARGEYHELNSHLSLAHADYSTGLKLFPSSVPLQKAAGRLAMELDRAAEAAPLLARVLAAVPTDVEAAYLLGAAEALLGRDAEARQAFERVPGNFEYSAAAALQLTEIAARAKDYPRALESLKSSRIAEPLRPVRFGAVEVALLRRSGKNAEAKRRLAAWLARDPADSMLRIESVWLGGEDPALWTHLAADSERVLNFADEYINLGMWEDALALLAHDYPAVPKDQMEPGAVPPGASPLIAYYRAYCRSRLGQDAGADPRAASSLPTRYVFPFRASSFAALTAALAANPSDATAHFLLGRLLLSRLMTDEAIAEWRRAQALKPAPVELSKELSFLQTNLKGDSSAAVASGRVSDLTAILPVATPAPPTIGAGPSPTSQSATEVAWSALLKAGAGKPSEAAGMFDAKVFTADKQPNEVRRAYIEVQLQAVLAQARSSAPLAALKSLDQLGGENTNLAFTFYGFNSFMGAPHFEYFSAMVEAACHDEKSSRKRWAKVSKMSAPLGSPEYVYPLLAAARIGPEDAKPKIAAALAAVRGAKAKADPASKSALEFSEAMLLHASGKDAEAAGQLETLAQDGTDQWIQYLALAGLREVLDGNK